MGDGEGGDGQIRCIGRTNEPPNDLNAFSVHASPSGHLYATKAFPWEKRSTKLSRKVIDAKIDGSHAFLQPQSLDYVSSAKNSDSRLIWSSGWPSERESTPDAQAWPRPRQVSVPCIQVTIKRLSILEASIALDHQASYGMSLFEKPPGNQERRPTKVKGKR